MPKHPQQKASLLSVPECGNQIIRWKFFVRVSVSVVIFEVMISDDRKERNYDSQHGHCVNIKSNPTIDQPLVLLLNIYFTSCPIVTEESNQRSNKGSDNKEM